jgi:hypothetical protein
MASAGRGRAAVQGRAKPDERRSPFSILAPSLALGKAPLATATASVPGWLRNLAAGIVCVRMRVRVRVLVRAWGASRCQPLVMAPACDINAGFGGAVPEPTAMSIHTPIL